MTLFNSLTLAKPPDMWTEKVNELNNVPLILLSVQGGLPVDSCRSLSPQFSGGGGDDGGWAQRRCLALVFLPFRFVGVS